MPEIIRGEPSSASSTSPKIDHIIASTCRHYGVNAASTQYALCPLGETSPILCRSEGAVRMDLTPQICKALSPFAILVSLAFPSLDKIVRR
jgi:hypothetical protein